MKHLIPILPDRNEYGFSKDRIEELLFIFKKILLMSINVIKFLQNYVMNLTSRIVYLIGTLLEI